MARHQHFHEVFGFTIAGFSRDLNFVNVFAVQITNRAFDQTAFFIDQTRRAGLQCQCAHIFPQSQKIFKIPFDFGFGAIGPGCAQNDAHTRCNFQRIGDRFEPLAISRIGDLAGNPTASGSIRHQH